MVPSAVLYTTIEWYEDIRQMAIRLMISIWLPLTSCIMQSRPSTEQHTLVESLFFTLAASIAESVMEWSGVRPSVRLSVCPVVILTATSVDFGPT